MPYNLSRDKVDELRDRAIKGSPLTKKEKEGLIEPVFDYWIGVPENKLKEKGLNRMKFEEWINFKLSNKL